MISVIQMVTLLCANCKPTIYGLTYIIQDYVNGTS